MFETFGDQVEVKSTTETLALGLAGKKGEIFGETTPSITEVEVIGDVIEDYAINVFFEELNEGFWFSSDLLEPVDSDPDREIEITVGRSTFTKNKDGSWEDRTKADLKKKQWWKFW